MICRVYVDLSHICRIYTLICRIYVDLSDRLLPFSNKDSVNWMFFWIYYRSVEMSQVDVSIRDIVFSLVDN